MNANATTTTLPRRTAAKTTRRAFLGATVATGAVTALGSRVALADPANPGRGDAVVQIYLRGGADVLSILPPTSYGSYYDYRQRGDADVSVPAGQALGTGHPVFGFHPAMAPLMGAWNAGQLAIVPAAGLHSSLSTSRSHFHAQDVMEGAGQTRSGWLGRHLTSSGGNGPVAAASLDRRVHLSLASGPSGTLSFQSIRNFGLYGYENGTDAAASLGTMYPSGSGVGLLQDGASTLSALGAVSGVDFNAFPAQATYPNSTLARRLAEIGQLLRSGVGIRGATVDSGGWDVHGQMGTVANGTQRNLIADLAGSLAAFMADLGSMAGEVTVVVLSEFGRTINVNGSGGTDHGRGGIMMVLGNNVNGGVHGDFPDRIEEGPEGDLAVVTDYRRVLSEVIERRLDNGGSLGQIFPGYSYPGALGICS